MPTEVPPDPTPGPPPDPIPASYYARSDATGNASGRTTGESAWRDVVNGIRGWSVWEQALAAIAFGVADARGWPRWKQALVAIAFVVSVVWIVQAPWRPALGLLGFLTLATVVLATDAWGLRTRVPLLGSRDPLRMLAGWSLVAGALLLTSAVVMTGQGRAAPARANATAPPTRAPGSRPMGTPSPVVAAPTPTLGPSPTPTPRIVPTAVPTPIPTPTRHHGRPSSTATPDSQG